MLSKARRERIHYSRQLPAVCPQKEGCIVGIFQTPTLKSLLLQIELAFYFLWRLICAPLPFLMIHTQQRIAKDKHISLAKDCNPVLLKHDSDLENSTKETGALARRYTSPRISAVGTLQKETLEIYFPLVE